MKNLLRLYEQYVQRNHTWLFQGAPRRTDLRLYEAVYRFSARKTPCFSYGDVRAQTVLSLDIVSRLYEYLFIQNIHT